MWAWSPYTSTCLHPADPLAHACVAPLTHACVLAHQILVISKGVVVERGTHAELVGQSGGAYAAFMKHQLVKGQA